MFPGNAFPGADGELQAALRGKEARFEHRLPRRDNARPRDIEAFFRPHRAPDGEILGVVTLLTDVTERKEMERALGAARDAAEGANRAKSAFLANMSHELRTPLSAVIGYAELLEEEAEDSGDASTLSDLAKIKSNAKHLLGLINDVLDLSKVEANKMELVPEDIEIAAFVRDTGATVDSLAARKGNTLVVDVPDGLNVMRTDAVKLRQCLFNLLSNAAKFTEAGTITLSARREAADGAEWVELAVKDDGIGMTPEQVSRLFQRFTQADAATTRKFGGTGLGLALSRAFAQLMGGDITVESVEGHLGAFALGELAKGRPAQLLVPPDMLHDFAYVPDIARAAVTLLDAPDDAFGQAWNMPCAPTRSPRDLLAIGAATLHRKLRIWAVPLWLMRPLGLVYRMAREVVDVAFTWDRPYLVDGGKFTRRFGFAVTPFEVGMVTTARAFIGEGR